MWKYAIKVAYEGTTFCGWQRQVLGVSGELPSVQQCLEEALTQVTQESTAMVGSGRTDSGVHAVGQVAHFVLKQKAWPPERLMAGLNSTFLQDPMRRSIRILACKRVPLEFHAQKSAIKKQYGYYFQQGPASLPHLEPYSWWIRKTLDLDAMNEALKALHGKHDFKIFQAAGSKTGPTVREIFEAKVIPVSMAIPLVASTEKDGIHLVKLEMSGTGFLKQMVRSIAGTVLEVGEHKQGVNALASLLGTPSRQELNSSRGSSDGPRLGPKLGMTAPGRGLWLENVWYQDFEW